MEVQKRVGASKSSTSFSTILVFETHGDDWGFPVAAPLGAPASGAQGKS
jgi:hypothetical protein